MYTLTRRRVHATIFALEMPYVLCNLSVCVCVCGPLNPACNAHESHCHLRLMGSTISFHITSHNALFRKKVTQHLSCRIALLFTAVFSSLPGF